MTRLFAVELADTGVRFINVDPGDMDTRMHAEALPDADPSTLGRPADAAARIVEIIRRSDQIPNGSRLTASEMEVLR
jgi:NAD(P)-dependent dehydrogenase (short-subunit alcohol dehydrogenase family)